MALQNPFHIPIPKTAFAAPKPVVGPQNQGLPTYRPGDVNNPFGARQGVLPVAAAPAPAIPAPPPVDFNAMTLADPQYTTGVSDLNRQNELAMHQLMNQFKQTSQGYQDNANAHNALFSGAAVHAQNYAGQQFADQSAQQAQNLQSGQHNLYSNVFQRLLQQLAGGGA